jgi:hypothetical protein
MKEKEFIRYIADTDRIRQKIYLEKSNVTKFVVQYESFLQNTWQPIIRYDTAHGYFHKDILNPDGSKVQRKITCFTLNDALTFAEQDIIRNWPIYKNTYIENETLKGNNHD